ncbi:MAG: ankyrin repeat domain-containing protein [Pseudomonadota bacterium]
MMAAIVLQVASLVFAIASVLVAVVWLADRYLPARFVQERHDIAVVTILLVPILFLLALRPALPETVTPAAALAPLDEALSTVTQTAVTAGQSPDSAISVQTAAAIPWTELAIGLWALVSLILAARIALELRAVLRLKAESRLDDRHARIRLSRPIPIRTARHIHSPMLVGYFRPVILLPERAGEETVSSAVLEHEVAHAVRSDAWVALALRITMAVFWWIVPLRLLNPIIDRSREMLADTYAAERTGAPVELAHALLDTAAYPLAKSVPALAAGAHGSALPERIRRLAEQNRWQPRTTWARFSMLLPALVVAAWIMTPRFGEAQDSSTDAEDIISAWVDRGADADLPLYRAARSGRLEEVRRLVAAGEDPSALSDGDGTPLMAAIRGRHFDVMEFLLASGADPNTVAPGDGTALIAAVRLGEPDLVRRLLDAGADPSLAVRGDGSPLISAANRGLTDVIDLLLAAGGDPNGASPRDGNPLIAAALAGEVAATERLLAAGADPNGFVYRDEMPLINAAQQGHLDVLNVLIAAGADVSLTVQTPHHDPGGPYRSPLSEAERHGHEDVVRRLRELGAEHRVPDDE